MNAPTASAERFVLAADRVLLDGVLVGPGWVAVEAGRVAAAGDGPVPPAERGPVTRLDGCILAPGFVDVHQHGGGGAAHADGPDAARTALAAHRRHGTTSSVASLVTDDVSTLERQVSALSELVADDDLAGIHLEGPWLSPLHRGAHDPALLREPVWSDVERVVRAAAGGVRVVTLAPELPGALEAARGLRDLGVVVAAGHSDATYAQGRAALAAGTSLGTHLFNAQRAQHQREPGLALALLEDAAVTVELIADGVHVHPALLRSAMRQAPGRVALVSDAMAAAGAPDGDYRLGSLDVRVSGGVATLAGTDTLAGSTLTLDRAVRLVVTEAGVDLETALVAASAVPARVLDRPDIGRIAPDCHADLVALDEDLAVRAVWRRGVPVALG